MPHPSHDGPSWHAIFVDKLSECNPLVMIRRAAFSCTSLRVFEGHPSPISLSDFFSSDYLFQSLSMIVNFVASRRALQSHVVEDFV